MKKYFLSICILAMVIMTPKVYATGSAILSANKSSVNIGEEFDVTISLSRCRSSITYC